MTNIYIIIVIITYNYVDGKFQDCILLLKIHMECERNSPEIISRSGTHIQEGSALHLLPYVAVKNVWSCTSTSTCLHGMVLN
jgi:hypothetical protein